MKNLVIGYGNVGKLIAAELKNAGEHISVGRHTAGESDGYSAVSVDLTRRCKRAPSRRRTRRSIRDDGVAL